MSCLSKDVRSANFIHFARTCRLVNTSIHQKRYELNWFADVKKDGQGCSA